MEMPAFAAIIPSPSYPRRNEISVSEHRDPGTLNASVSACPALVFSPSLLSHLLFFRRSHLRYAGLGLQN